MQEESLVQQISMTQAVNVSELKVSGSHVTSCASNSGRATYRVWTGNFHILRSACQPTDPLSRYACINGTEYLWMNQVKFVEDVR